MECKPLLTGEYTEVLNGEVMFGDPKYGPKLNIDGSGASEYSPTRSSEMNKGSPTKSSFDKLGILSQPGGGV